MTAELYEEIEPPTKPDKNTKAEMHFELPPEITELFEFLSHNKSIVFKSQQIDDPEIERSEKVQIARDIYIKNRHTFLMRFGGHLEERHLESFARLALSDGSAALRPDEHCEEMQFMLKDYQRKLHTRRQDVKNRRYAAMQNLEKQGEYFSEQEMMRRAPALYQELIGQYLSEAEKQKRDGYDVKNTTFSGILMHSLEKQQLEDVIKQAEESNKTTDEVVEPDDDGKSVKKPTPSPGGEDDKEDEEVPAAFRQQWGNFDNEKIACSSSRSKPAQANTTSTKTKSKKLEPADQRIITAGERNLLRQEFIGLMHERFLAGQEQDFDYTQVDDNSMLDDLRQLNQDKEDAYFKESEDEEENEAHHIEFIQGITNESDEDSADELDIYMSHLSKHHSLQN